MMFQQLLWYTGSQLIFCDLRFLPRPRYNTIGIISAISVWTSNVHIRTERTHKHSSHRQIRSGMLCEREKIIPQAARRKVDPRKSTKSAAWGDWTPEINVVSPLLSSPAKRQIGGAYSIVILLYALLVWTNRRKFSTLYVKAKTCPRKVHRVFLLYDMYFIREETILDRSLHQKVMTLSILILQRAERVRLDHDSYIKGTINWPWQYIVCRLEVRYTESYILKITALSSCLTLCHTRHARKSYFSVLSIQLDRYWFWVHPVSRAPFRNFQQEVEILLDSVFL